MSPPMRYIRPESFRGVKSSIIYDNMYGSTSSAALPTVLVTRPSVSPPEYGLMYARVFFIGIYCGSFCLFAAGAYAPHLHLFSETPRESSINFRAFSTIFSLRY